jgi:hypothetical protein
MGQRRLVTNHTNTTIITGVASGITADNLVGHGDDSHHFVGSYRLVLSAVWHGNENHRTRISQATQAKRSPARSRTLTGFRSS